MANLKNGEFETWGNLKNERSENIEKWELILQDSQGEYYFGQDLDYELLVSALNQIFDN